jgi:hypothetical protein
MKLGISVSKIVASRVWCGAIFALSMSGVLSAQTAQSALTRLPLQTYKQLKEAHPELVQVPGNLMRSDCVHEIPNGAKVVVGSDGKTTGDVMKDGAVIAHYAPCSEEPIATRHMAAPEQNPMATLNHAPLPSFNGWVADMQENLSLGASDNVDWESGQFLVPNKPSVNGGTIFLFNGIAPTGENWILQPVLQYGVSAAGGGNYWAIASWFVGTGGAWHSPLETVNAGDTIYGYTEQTATGSTLDYVSEARDLKTGAYSYLDVYSTGLHWTWAYAGVLEVYNVNSCSQLPSSGYAYFNNSYVYHGFPYFDYVASAFTGDVFQSGCGDWVYTNNTSNYDYIFY